MHRHFKKSVVYIGIFKYRCISNKAFTTLHMSDINCLFEIHSKNPTYTVYTHISTILTIWLEFDVDACVAFYTTNESSTIICMTKTYLSWEPNTPLLTMCRYTIGWQYKNFYSYKKLLHAPREKEISIFQTTHISKPNATKQSHFPNWSTETVPQ